MNDMRNKIFSLLVLLMTAATGAWAQDYYLVGTMNDWGASKQFQLTQNPGNPEYMITLTLKEGDEFKVIGVDGDGNWTWYPGGYNYYVEDAGEYTVYFRPDYSGGDDWYEHCIYAAATPDPAIPVTDLGSGQWQFTMPDYAVVANIEYDTELELRDVNVNTTVLADWDGYEADVTLQRKLIGGTWNTLAVPFNVTDVRLSALKGMLTAQGASLSVKQLVGSSLEGETVTLTFENADKIDAGIPYLVKVTGIDEVDLSKIPFTGIEVRNTTKPVTSLDYIDFIPTLGKTTITGVNADDVLFLAADNKLKNPSSIPADMKGFRAYFQLKDDAVNARVFNLDLGEGETTGISSMHNSECIMHNEYFDLQGRKVQNAAQKGIYIMNGRKVVNK